MLLLPMLLASQDQSQQLNQGAGLLSGEYSLLSQQPNFGLQMGTSFSSGFGGGSLFSQSISPYMQLQPGQNFSLMVGTTFTTGQFSGVQPLQSSLGAEMPQRMNSAVVYAMGAYQVNQKLTITGGAWTERNNMNLVQEPQMNSQAFNNNARGMMLGMDYQINDKMSFGAEVNISTGHNPFNPYSSNPFRSNPFHRNNPW